MTKTETPRKVQLTEPYVYVLVRTDLPLPQQAVQATHAAMISARKLFPEQLTFTPNLVLCQLPDGESLQTAHETLVRQRVPCVPYFEPDYGNAMTAIATGPLVGEQRKLLKGYKLLK